MEIVVDWARIEGEDEFYDSLLAQLESPSWHGRNLDALSDSVVTGDINGIEPPFSVTFRGTDRIREELRVFAKSVMQIFAEAIDEGREIELNEYAA